MLSSHALAAWHDAALRLPLDDYRGWSLARLKPLLGFDHAAWVLSPMGEHGRPMVRGTHCAWWPQGDGVPGVADGWLDRLLAAAQRQVGRALCLPSPAAAATAGDHRLEVLCMAGAERRGHSTQCLVLVRGPAPDRFTADERRRFQQVAPHLMQGFATAQAVFAAEHGRTWTPPAPSAGAVQPQASTTD
jgi:hypothetical protein